MGKEDPTEAVKEDHMEEREDLTEKVAKAATVVTEETMVMTKEESKDQEVAIESKETLMGIDHPEEITMKVREIDTETDQAQDKEVLTRREEVATEVVTIKREEEATIKREEAVSVVVKEVAAVVTMFQEVVTENDDNYEKMKKYLLVHHIMNKQKSLK